MKLSDFLAKTLKTNDINTVFGIPSYIGMELLEAFSKENFDIILNAHEQNAAHMAEGYFYATNKPAILSVVVGPGLTNAITGIANAYIESIPMLVLAARPAANVRGRNEYHANTGYGRTLDERELLKSCTKGVFLVDSDVNAESIIYDALRTMVSDRPGPVYLSIPPEIQKSEITSKILHFENFAGKVFNRIDESSLKEIEESFKQAQKPLIMLGNQVRGLDKEKLARFLNDNCPYFTSYGAKGFVPLLPNYLGTAWYANAENIVSAANEADTILAIGEDFTHFTYRIFSDLKFQTEKRIIQINEYVEEIGRSFQIHNGYVCSIKDFIERLNLDKKPWISKKTNLNFDYSVFNTVNIIKQLPDLLPDNSVIFSDVGNAGYTSISDMELKANQQFFTPGKFGVCGWALPTAISYSHKIQKAPVFTLIGDLAFNMNINSLMELATLHTHSSILLFNNKVPQNITQDQILALGHEIQSEMINPNFEGIAYAFGLKYLKISNNYELNKIKNCNYMKERFLIEFILDQTDTPRRKL